MNDVKISFGPVMKILFALIGIGAVVALLRFIFGIGFISNLSDGYPWGIWIGFDVVSGVALAAGGFTTAAAVHIFGREKYHPLVRPAILTAFLGYLLVIVALTVDLGRFWNIWRPMYHIQHRSVMFEVGTCVALYTTVLAIEFSPMFFERFKMEKALRLVTKYSIWAIIAGVILSTLHQSSLGSVFLIVPHKLHPLWYTPILPILFLVSAIALGPAMVILEGNLSAKAFKREYETSLLGGLARALPFILGIYLIMKAADLIVRGATPYLFAANTQATMFWLELLIGVVAPIVLLINKEIYTSRKGQLWGAICVVLGIVLNRINVSVVGILVEKWETYYPAIGEIAVTVGMVSLGLVAFYFVAKYFPVFHEAHTALQRQK
jgi:Ni/Fe-hydrogenase subunit HybB-like protein